MSRSLPQIKCVEQIKPTLMISSIYSDEWEGQTRRLSCLYNSALTTVEAGSSSRRQLPGKSCWKFCTYHREFARQVRKICRYFYHKWASSQLVAINLLPRQAALAGVQILLVKIHSVLVSPFFDWKQHDFFRFIPVKQLMDENKTISVLFNSGLQPMYSWKYEFWVQF